MDESFDQSVLSCNCDLHGSIRLVSDNRRKRQWLFCSVLESTEFQLWGIHAGQFCAIRIADPSRSGESEQESSCGDSSAKKTAAGSGVRAFDSLPATVFVPKLVALGAAYADGF